MLHVPAPVGVTAYVALPALVAPATTDAISPLGGLHVSLSVNVPLYPPSVNVRFCAPPDENASDAGDATGVGAGVAVLPVEGDAVALAIVAGVAEPPPPQAARSATRSNA
jgi:hypothetical protein